MKLHRIFLFISIPVASKFGKKILACSYPNLCRFTARTRLQKLRDFLPASCIAISSFIKTRSIMMKLNRTLDYILIRMAFKFSKKILACSYPNLCRFTARTPLQKLRDVLPASFIASSSFIKTRSIMITLSSTLLNTLIQVAFKFCKKNPASSYHNLGRFTVRKILGGEKSHH